MSDEIPERCDHNEFWTCTTQREAGWILISCDICPAEWQEMLPGKTYKFIEEA